MLIVDSWGWVEVGGRAVVDFWDALVEGLGTFFCLREMRTGLQVWACVSDLAVVVRHDQRVVKVQVLVQVVHHAVGTRLKRPLTMRFPEARASPGSRLSARSRRQA